MKMQMFTKRFNSPFLTLSMSLFKNPSCSKMVLNGTRLVPFIGYNMAVKAVVV